MKDNGYSVNWDEKRRDFEIKMLLTQKVNIMAATYSLSRYTYTRDIFYQNRLEDAGKDFQNYVDLYKYFNKNYGDLGSPTEW